MQEQRRERVLDYMLPPSQPSVSMSSICLEMRRDNKQYVDILLRPISTMGWVKVTDKLLGLRHGYFGGNFARALLWQRPPFEVDIL